MEIFSGVTAADVDQATTRPAPPVGTSWTDSLEGTIGVATHHDGKLCVRVGGLQLSPRVSHSQTRSSKV